VNFLFLGLLVVKMVDRMVANLVNNRAKTTTKTRHDGKRKRLRRQHG